MSFFPHNAFKAQEQFSEYSMFEYLYVKAGEATYAIEILKEGETHLGGHRVDYFKTVNIYTGEELRRGSTLHHCEKNELISALDAHYNAEYVRTDGIALSVEQVTLPSGFAIDMPFSAMFGQCVHYDYVDELHVIDIDGLEHCFS